MSYLMHIFYTHVCCIHTLHKCVHMLLRLISMCPIFIGNIVLACVLILHIINVTRNFPYLFFCLFYDYFHLNSNPCRFLFSSVIWDRNKAWCSPRYLIFSTFLFLAIPYLSNILNYSIYQVLFHFGERRMPSLSLAVQRKPCHWMDHDEQRWTVPSAPSSPHTHPCHVLWGLSQPTRA